MILFMATNKSNKQKWIKNAYVTKLKDSKEAMSKRREYLKEWTLPQTEESSTNNTPSPSTGNAVEDTTDNIVTPSGGEDALGLIALAKTKMGAPYVFGSNGPNTFDCSGFVWWVCNQKGYTFGRSNCKGYYSWWEKTNNPQPGDIIFFSNTYTSGLSHVGFWMGDNQFIHTANPQRGVEISQLTGYWKEKFTSFAKLPPLTKSNKKMVSSINTATSTAIIGDGPANITDEEWEETKVVPEYVYSYKAIKFRKNGVMIRPKDTRSGFLHERIGWGRTTDYEGYVSLDKKRFIHDGNYDGYEGNLYSPDAKKLFENLLLKTKKPYFEVISGFRFSEEKQLSPHEAGCAIDILTRTIDEAREIADCAWQLGVRSISIGGDFTKNTGFIHIDIAPKGIDIQYGEVPIYGGPGKWEIQ